jgi:hypothetical protein
MLSQALGTETLMMAKYQTIKKFSQESGYTEAAIRTKMQDGTWKKGAVWIKAPDNRVLISVEGYNAWAEGELESEQHPERALKLVSCSTASSAAKESRLSPPPLT